METKVNPEEFVEVWQSSHSLDEVAERTGLAKTSAAVKASAYRKRGVQLKSFSKKKDWKALSELAKELS